MDVKHDKKRLWGLVTNLSGRAVKSSPTFLEVEGKFLTKPVLIANYFSEYFCDKINNLQSKM